MEILTMDELSPPLLDIQLKQIMNLGEQIWKKSNNFPHVVDSMYQEIHDITNTEYQYISNISTDGRNKIIELVNKIEYFNKQINEIEIQLRNAPNEEDIEEDNEKIDSLSKKIGETELRLKTAILKLSKSKENKYQLTNLITRLVDQGESFENLRHQLDHINKLINAVSQYISRMTIIKAKFIKEEFANMLMQLMRKSVGFGKVEFDTSTYTVRLFNDRGQEISIRDRSAGEMQIISSALIWALTKASDLSLPMVIDTPLGRLDSIHRDHLVKHYYNQLSEQVIILSTDTEITKDYMDLMGDYSYRQYMLDYDQEKGYTIVRDGYFRFSMEVE
jgi:DNA sulfur modification protein DndD